MVEYNLYVGVNSVEIAEMFLWHGTDKNTIYQVSGMEPLIFWQDICFFLHLILNLYLCVTIICKRTLPEEFMFFILAFVTLIFYLY